jgi:homoserine O-succinyltransferase
MPVIIPDKLPAKKILHSENIFVMEHSQAIHQDIRPLRIAILNIMPLKIATETHILRLLTNTPLQVEVELIIPKAHESKNTSSEHLQYFYKSFTQIKENKFDGLIITGAPIEHLEFEEVDYWNEIKKIMDWSEHHVTSSLFICWAAQAALFHFYKIQKYPLEQKMFGNFFHTVNKKNAPIVRGFDDGFLAPHSRHTEVRRNDILKVRDLEIISESDEAGIYLVTSREGKKVFVTGHSEYDPLTLKEEYERDKNKGLPIHMPKNYFQNNDPSKPPIVSWRSHAYLLFQNWLNYYVYQATPYNIAQIQ